MSDLVRKQVYITRDQDKLLKKKADEMGVTEAELVREALDSQADKIPYPHRAAEKWQEELRFIRDRISIKQDSHDRRTWKREDLYDR